ncbi:NADH-quinone oxidoreductase subunit NuoE [Chloroflexota bacterium]
MPGHLAEVLAPYKGKQGVLIPILQKVQEELGFLSEEAVAEIAKFLGISKNQVFGVLTFYAQFRTTPLGKNCVMVCRGTACHVQGGTRILEAIERELGIKEGETSADLEYSLETVACIGACALAPTIVINDETHGRLTTKKVAEIFEQRRKGG